MQIRSFHFKAELKKYFSNVGHISKCFLESSAVEKIHNGLKGDSSTTACSTQSENFHCGFPQSLGQAWKVLPLKMIVLDSFPCMWK